MDESVRIFFQENGYYLARGVFSAEEIVLLEKEFGRIVSQISTTGEEIDATWACTEHPDERLVLKGWNYHSSRNRAGLRK